LTVDQLVVRLADLDSCAVSDALDRLGFSGVALGIRPLWACPRTAGRVVTVKLVPAVGQKSSRHLGTAAVDCAGSGDVIVVDHGARCEVAGWGGILSLAAKTRGIEGVIVDGACRDLDEAREMTFPVFGRAAVPVTARGRVIEESFNQPIHVAGVLVTPGDLVLADSSGVVFISAARADEVIGAAEEIRAREARMASDVRAGLSVVEVMGSAYESMAGKQ
jgi:regulator of RNase E activity RraA